MIRRNADIISIAFLLAVIALYVQARDMMLIQVNAQHGITLANDICQRLVDLRSARVPTLTPLSLICK